jgi:hypothetical protein
MRAGKILDSIGEFDPGSELTLAACLTHASRARNPPSGGEYSGARVSSAWVIYLCLGDNTPKGVLIPHNPANLRVSRQRWPLDQSCRIEMSPRPISLLVG